MLKVTKPLHQRELVIINVGANTSHSGLYSPLYEDGTFSFMPLPEEGDEVDPKRDLYPGCPTLPTFTEFLGSSKLTQCFSKKYLAKTVHDDPEFVTFTYGDNPDTIAKSKASNLRKHLKKCGDLLFFFAGLTAVKSKPERDYNFYFIGFFEIDGTLPSVNGTPTKDELKLFGRNAHIKRGHADFDFFNSFWVWKGSSNSQLFRKAVLFDKKLGEKILLSSSWKPYTWPNDKTSARLLGSRTRTSRWLRDEQRKRILLQQVINAGNDVPLFRRLLESA